MTKLDEGIPENRTTRISTRLMQIVAFALIFYSFGCEDTVTRQTVTKNSSSTSEDQIADEVEVRVEAGRRTRADLGDIWVELPADAISDAMIRLKRSEAPDLNSENAAVLTSLGDPVDVTVVRVDTGDLVEADELNEALEFTQVINSPADSSQIIAWVQTPKGSTHLRSEELEISDDEEGESANLVQSSKIRVSFKLRLTQVRIALFEKTGDLAEDSSEANTVIRRQIVAKTDREEEPSTTTGDDSESSSSGGDSGSGGTGGEVTEHRIMLTSAGYTSNLMAEYNSTHSANAPNALAAADGLCQYEALSSQLPGTWKAIISDSATSARDRIVINGPIRMFGADNPLVLEDPSKFWSGGFLRSINRNGRGLEVNAVLSEFWFASLTDGSADSNGGNFCNNWQSSLPSSTYGARITEVGQGVFGFAPLTASCTASKTLLCIDGQ